MAVGAADAHAARQPLRTALIDPVAYYGSPSEVQAAFARTRAAGATFVRLYVGWSRIAPDTPTRPAGFNPANPGDPHYSFSYLDMQVRLARQAGLQPILCVLQAPQWAERGRKGPPSQYPTELAGSVNPDPAALGAFATAISTRYSGHYGGLPRVRYWQVWNEPNLYDDLGPQFSGPEATSSTPSSQPLPAGAVPTSPALYRALVNAFGHPVHHVHANNVVLAGGLAPFQQNFDRAPAVAPLRFMRQMLCVAANDKPLRGCGKVDFDIWAHDAYTDGDPEHRALLPGDVSIPELPEMHRVLMAAARGGHIKAGRKADFWITEFSWNTNPASPGGVPIQLQARWVAEGLYRMWTAGVSLVTWFLLRDEPGRQVAPDAYLSGLYFDCPGGIGCDTPKPSLTAFRFPLVAYRRGGRVFVWGRTPSSRGGRVNIEQASGRRWRVIGRLRADSGGIFQGTLRRRGGGDVRARVRGSASLPFSLRRPPDMTVNPFG